MKLSIIIPTLNEEEFLPILLDQINKQGFKGLEVVVADAGSTDKTVEISKNWGCIIVRGGLPAVGRNAGARAAKGDILLFMDADNIFLPKDFLKNLINEFEKRKLEVASFPIYTDSPNLFDKLVYILYNFWVKISQPFVGYAFNSTLIRKDLHKKINGFDETIKLAEDQEYVKRARKSGKFGFINTAPVITSARRLYKHGRLKSYFQYILAGAWMVFFGPVRSDLFKYKFYNELINKQKNKH